MRFFLQSIFSQTFLTASPSLSRRSMSPSPRRLIDMRKKQTSLEIPPPANTHNSTVQIPLSQDETVSNGFSSENKIESSTTGSSVNDGANKYENISDNGSEISDEGYRSLGLIHSNNAKRISLHSQVSNEDADTNGKRWVVQISWDSFINFTWSTGRLDRNSPEINTPASDETTISETKAESPISDESEDSIKGVETAFAKSGIVMIDDDISVDIASATGLRKTGFSEVLYEDNPVIAAKKAVQSKIPKSPMLIRRKSTLDNCSTTMNDEEESIRRIPAYRSVRKPQQQKDRTPLKENTWNGRSSVSPTNQAKKRPTITSDTFKSPSRTASLTRNTPSRSSQQPDGRTRQRSSTRASSSVNTSPSKMNNNNMQSPLAQQLLEAAGKARNDAQILGKIKRILSDYATKNKINSDFDDFTATWVNNNGNLDNTNDDADNVSSANCLSKKSIQASADSNPTTPSREAAAAAVITPRRVDKGMSRIPAPVRSNTGLYWQRSSSLIVPSARNHILRQHLNNRKVSQDFFDKTNFSPLLM